MTKKIHTLGNW